MNDRPIECPFCSSGDTELISLFGGQLLTVQYYCRHCSTPFERIKGEDVIEDATRHVQTEQSALDNLAANVPACDE